MDIITILKEFGFPIALCALLLWAIMRQNAQLVKAYTDRIGTLERIVNRLTDKVNELEQDRIRRSDEYGHTLKNIAVNWSAATKETNEVTRTALAVMRRLCDSINLRPCMRDMEPHPIPQRTPSSAEIPADPPKPTTDRYQSHA